MSIEEQQHVALPKLYGGPAYARPTPPAEVAPRPFDPDDLPIEAAQTEEDRVIVSRLPATVWAPGGAVIDLSMTADAGSHTSTGLTPRSFSLRAIAGRLLGGD